MLPGGEGGILCRVCSNSAQQMEQPLKSKLGIHYANANFRALEQLSSIAWNAVTVLHLNRNRVPEIRAKYPDALLLIRAYLDNWYTTDPGRWAQEIATWWKDVAPFTKHLTWANEQNLTDEGHPLGAGTQIYPPRQVYEDIRDWNLIVIAELRQLCPGAILHFPALSQGHSDDQNDAGYVGFEILRSAVDACDYLDVHTYWNGAANRESVYFGRRYEKLRALFPDKRMFISECGADVDMQRNDGADYVAWLNGLPDYVEGACFFIWDSDGANAGWTIWNKPRIVDALKNYAPPSLTTVEYAVREAASHSSWMPINRDAALYKVAQKNGLGYPQTDEKEIVFGEAEWLFQVFQGGIVYVKKGDWGDVKWIKKT